MAGQKGIIDQIADINAIKAQVTEVNGELDKISFKILEIVKGGAENLEKMKKAANFSDLQKAAQNFKEDINKMTQAEKERAKVIDDNRVLLAKATDILERYSADTYETQKALAKVKSELISVNEKIRENEKEYKSGVKTEWQYIDASTELIKKQQELKAAQSEYSLHLKEAVKYEKANEDTDKGRAVILGRLKDLYRNLTDEEKESINQTKGLIDVIQKLDNGLKESDAAIGNHQRKVGNYEVAGNSMRSELTKMTNELAQMRLEGESGGEEYENLARKAAEYKQSVNLANSELKNLASGTGNLKAVGQAVQGVMASYAAFKGVTAALGIENKNLEKSMNTLMGLMTAMNSLTQMSNVFRKDSALMVALQRVQSWALTKAKEQEAAAIARKMIVTQAETSAMAGNTVAGTANTAATAANTVAATTGTVANTGLAASFHAVKAAILSIPGFGWILAVMTALIALVSYFSKETSGASKKQEELNKKMEESKIINKEQADEISKSYGQSIGKIEALRAALDSENISRNNKLKIVRELSRIIPGYNAKLSEEGRIIWENKGAIDAYLASLEKQLKFKAAESRLQELANKQMQLEITNKDAILAFKAFEKPLPGETEQSKKARLETLKIYRDQYNVYKMQTQEIKNQSKEIENFIKRNDLFTELDFNDSKGSSGGENKTIERIKTELKAYGDLNELTEKINAEKNKAVVDQDKNSYNERINLREAFVNKQKELVGKEMTESFNGNVDLLARPLVDAAELVKKGWEDAGEGIATVFSSQFGIEDKDGNIVEILVTPILPDGTILSPEELDGYIHGQLEGAESILAADTKGIVISVDVDPDGEAGERLHQLQEQYHNLNDEAGQNKIIESDEEFFSLRLNALDKYIKARQSAVEASRKADIDELRNKYKGQFKTEEEFQKIAANSIKLINTTADNEKTKITEDGENLRLKITGDYIKEKVKALKEGMENEANAIKDKEQKEYVELSEAYASGKLTKEQYEREKNAVEQKYRDLSFQNEIDHLKKMAGLIEDPGERDAVLKQINDKEIKYNEDKNNAIVKSNEDTAKKKEKIEEDLAKRIKELQKKLLSESVSLLKDALSAQFEAQIESLENQKTLVDERKDHEIAALEAMGLSSEEYEARKAMAERRADEQKKQIEERQKKIKIQQAKFEKAVAAMEIGVSTAAAVMKNIKQLGYIPAIPINILTIALGAVQLATVLAKPIPQYARGTKDHPGGPAFLGDAGKSEAIILPGGTVMKSPSHKTLLDLPEHTAVLPDFNDIVKFSEGERSYKINRILKYERRGNNFNDKNIIKAIRDSQTLLNINLDRNGMWRYGSGKAEKIRILESRLRLN
ncbi:MAG: hypothetical protein FWF54_03645 [Candidatus Azobacteroides sp.]|nr:hypothetical protein [Candidatus Azobacteroides sp.]